ncbi:MAG: hypothetical protein E7812_15860 [Phenylobacterium sp.]|nr:MAG: hypothetical protein E7812_15860 [Phenylobacterium sp.]
MPILIAILAAAFLGLLNCLLALVKGDAAERLGAGVIIANLAVAFARQMIFHGGALQVAALCNDGLTALVLLALTLRYASLWLGVVMLLYALLFGLNAYYFVLERHGDLLYMVVSDVDFFGVNLALFVGTVTAWTRRRQIATAPAPAPALAEAAP